MINGKFIYFVFFLSGLSGLVYELLWSHYLKTFLGHAAYAQSLVLCIFMGGMAFGSYLSSRFSAKFKKPLFLYASIEGIIGIFAVFFHLIFNFVTDFSYNYVFHFLENSYLVIFYKIFISSLIVTPQTILLGMTFPVISYYFVRNNPEDTAKSISFLYFSNSIGAALGVFITGFYLVEHMGMPYTISLAGALNLIIFVIIYFKSKNESQTIPIKSSEEGADLSLNNRFFYILFFTACFTGFSSFIYEIVWIRMLSLVLGSSTHNFEIMLCAFITGIALGGLYIRLRADKIKDPVSYLANVQLLMGISAVLTLPLYNLSFSIISYLINNLPKSNFGFQMFNVISHLISFAIMLPATIFAGMTFPLISYGAFKNGMGEKAIGYTYAINTIGAILGVIFAVHFGLPFMGIKNLLFFASFVDISLGILILFSLKKFIKPILSSKLVTGTSVSLLIFSFFTINLDAYKLSSGVYREGVIFNPQEYQLYFYKDGKTSSISVVGDKGYLSIRTNGKSDSAIAIDEKLPPSPDEYTVSLAALIPFLYYPAPENIAIIGLGTGLTTHVALLNPYVKEVDTVEIERAVIEGSKIFLPRIANIFNDKRSRIYIDDAKTFFSTHGQKYDVIISEPSNPWISGVATLFTTEFYSLTTKYLKPGGIFVQWIQLYEIDLPHIASIIKALSNNFADYAMYITTENELLIASSNRGLPCVSDYLFKIPSYKNLLLRLGISSVNDFYIRKIGDKKSFDNFFRSFDIRENSDFYPILERKAPKLRFFGQGAGQLLNILMGPVPVSKLLLDDDEDLTQSVNLTPFYQRPYLVKISNIMRDLILHGKSNENFDIPADVIAITKRFNTFLDNPDTIDTHTERLSIMFNIFSFLIPNLTRNDVNLIIHKIEKSKSYKMLSSLEVMWLMLFKSINNKNYTAISKLSLELLKRDTGLPPVAEEYLLASLMISNIMTQNDKEISDYIGNSTKIKVLQEKNVLFKYLSTYCTN